MTIYLVRANPKKPLLRELQRRLDSGEISAMRPFGRTLDSSLRNAKVDKNGCAVWEEEDYCSPPLLRRRKLCWTDILTRLLLRRLVKDKAGNGLNIYLRYGA